MDQHRKQGQIQLILVIAFIVGAFGISKLLQSTYEPPGENNTDKRIVIVETQALEAVSHRITFKTSGVVQARNQIQIVPEVSGRVIRVHDAFFSGGTFNAGEVLFEIDPRDSMQTVAQRQADVDRLQAALELAEAEVNAAKANWVQVNGNKPIPALVAKDPQLKQAKANLNAAIAQLKTAQLTLERTRFTLPFNGRVLDSEIAAGQYIMAGQSYGEVFDTATLEVKASLEGQQLDWLLGSPDPAITFSGQYLGKTFTYQGELKRSASSLDINTRFATVRFGFSKPVNDLLPGVFTDISVAGQTVDNVMLLPLTALQSRGVVWLVENGVLKQWIPEIIYTNSHYVVVKANAATITIVTSRVSGGANGMQVRIANGNGSEANHD